MDNCFIQPRRPVGLYRPEFEHDSCVVGFVANIKGLYSHSIIDDAYTVLRSMDHRGACGADENSGDGAGILTALPHQFLQRVVEEEANQFRGRCGQLDNLLQRDVPRMTGLLDRILVSLEEYVAISAPEPPPPAVSDGATSGEGGDR